MMVQFENVSHDYGKFRALHGVSFSIKEGALLALLGPNGAGKSTMMGIMTGLRSPAEGRVSIGGVDLLREPEAAKAAIGYLGEIPPLYPELSVFEYLCFAAGLQGLLKPQARVEEILALLQITDRRGSLIKNLSKGLRQRVGIAQSIIHRPKLLILDEPTVGLEPAQLIEFRSLIRTLAERDNMTVILSTHIMQEAAELCDEVIILSEGRIVFDGSKDVLLSKGSGFLYRAEARKLGGLAKKLLGLEGVLSVEQKKDSLLIACSSPLAEDIARLMLEEGCGFKSLAPLRNSLEEVFLNLTKGA